MDENYNYQLQCAYAAKVLAVAVLLGLILVLTGCNSGKTGQQGVKGRDGVPCSSQPTLTGIMITCPDGTTASLYNGIDGLNGQDGASITAIQLCPGETTYPGTFVEEALCIDNKLYAVYSYQNGFLTLLAPGAYQSNAVGSACNFTVTEGCNVVY